jgi:NAD(P)-dependent dehydrogenase (short-subunit alcohol dehydrogenase family)
VLSSFVVTGGGRGIGRAIVERLLHDGHGVAVLEFDTASVDWAEGHRYAHRLATVTGDAADVAIAERSGSRLSPAG